jgi:alpha/beta superfamily hydrolase
MRFAAAAAACVVACAGAASAAADESVVIPTRPGITVELRLVPTVGTPRAAVLLFPGGTGVIGPRNNNFLLRIRDALAGRGLLVAAVNVPSDKGAGGVDPNFRASEAAAQDIAAAVAEMKRRADVPVWLVGTSNGSISAANGAARIGPPQVAGAVLTSSVWSGGMSNVPIEKIAVPVLIVHNRNDMCPSAHFAGAEQALARLAAAPAKELVPVESTASESQPCEALAPHGYLGIEPQVTTIMADWILAHSPPVNK